MLRHARAGIVGRPGVHPPGRHPGRIAVALAMALAMAMAVPARADDDARVAVGVEDAGSDPAATLVPPVPTNRVRLPLAGRDGGLRWWPLLYGGTGLYVDHRPFFGQRDAFVGSSPIATPDGASRQAAVAELSVEPGLGFTRPLGDGTWTSFGAATVAFTTTQGADIYRRDGRVRAGVEKAFVGLLHRPADGPMLLVRAGRTSYTLDDGFLVHLVRTSSNAGDRRALNLGARSAADVAVVGDLRGRGWRVQAFAIDPDELPEVDTRSRFAGGQVSWQPTGTLDLAVTHLQVLRSDSLLRRPAATPIPREGLRATTLQARWRDAGEAPRWLLAGLVGEQRHDSGEVRARAGYVRAAHRWHGVPGRPAIEFRHARFSGDRPDTPRFERWDPLLAAGSDEWMGGIAFSKFQGNTNLVQDRLRLYTAPADGMALTVDLLRYRADQANNLGAGPLGATWPSTDLGHEVMAILRWTVGPRLYAQGVAAVNRPGEGVRRLLPQPARPWVTLQASLYWFFQ